MRQEAIRSATSPRSRVSLLKVRSWPTWMLPLPEAFPSVSGKTDGAWMIDGFAWRRVARARNMRLASFSS